jgi:predicted nucleotidyltransferase
VRVIENAARAFIETCCRTRGLRDPKMGSIIPNMGSKGVPVSLADALFSKTQQRVLGVLFGRPDQTFFANEIVRLAGGGFGAVHRELAALESAGLITSKHIGNQKHYQANRDAPIFDELRGIVVKTAGLADVLREALAPLAPRIRAAFVYGSVAKGTDTAKSDIDLMVVGEKVQYADIFKVVSGVENRLGRKINPTVVTPADLAKQRGQDSFYSRVLNQAKIFVIGAADDLAESRKARKGRKAQG